MSNDRPSPEQHAQGWRLICGGTHTKQLWIDASDATPSLLIARDSPGEWWAVAPQCRKCGSELAAAFEQTFAGASAVAEPASGLDEIGCRQCGTAHGPAVVGCQCVALMVVEDEIYAAPETK